MSIVRKEVVVSTFVTTDDVREYLSFPLLEKEMELAMAIESSVTYFENSRNISLRPMTLELSTTDDNGAVRLYHPKVAEVTEVVNARTGEALSFRTFGDTLLLEGGVYDVTVRVTYKTVECDNFAVYKNAVIGRAALIFDGSTDSAAYERVNRWA